MGVLANQSFVKMNGIGNEIVVVDMRARGGKIEAEEARAAGVPRTRQVSGEARNDPVTKVRAPRG